MYPGRPTALWWGENPECTMYGCRGSEEAEQEQETC